MEFLRNAAQSVIDNKTQWGNFILIFPNNRSITYFRKYYKDIIGHSVWAPQSASISRFLHDFVEGEKASQIQLSFYLYEAFKKVLGTDSDFADYTLEDFYPYAQIILNDFNEIDNYLIDADKIFVNLAQLEEFNLDSDFLSEEQIETIKRFWKNYNPHFKQKFLIKLWNNLSKIYDEFTGILENKGLTYGGLQRRRLVEKIKAGEIEFDRYDKYVFIGFNALSRSELEIMKAIKKQGKALFYWDYDIHYLNDKKQEAGIFLRKNISELGDDLKYGHDNLTGNKNIKIIGFPGAVGQAKAIGTILEQMGIDPKDTDTLSKTAIVLPDESMLFPVLHSIPEQIEKINITLSFPLRLTNLYPFFKAWFTIIKTFAKDQTVYYTLVKELLRSQIVLSVAPEKANELENKIIAENKIYIDKNFLTVNDNKFFELLFSESNYKSTTDFLKNTAQITDFLLDYYIEQQDDFNREFLFHVLQNTQSLYNLLLDEKIDLPLGIGYSIWWENIYSIRVPFEGKSTRGLQVITIMETRNIDFENIILLNMNEGIFPQVRRPQSFLTEFIRSAYGLPVIRYQDGIFAYFFYRLLQNAQNIYLLYSNIPTTQTGEISRFIEQLKDETGLINPQKDFLTYTENLGLPENNFELQTSDKIRERLNEINSLSASAMITYLNCPRKFYYQNIIRLKLPEEESAEIAVNQFGNIVHLTLEQLYSSVIENKDKSIVEKEDIKKLLQQAEKATIETAADYLQIKPENLQGINKLTISAAVEFVKKVLKYDMTNSAPFEIISLEKEKFGHGKGRSYNYTLTTIGDKKITIFGYIDRVDKVGEQIRIVDYKTGKKDKKLPDIEAIKEKGIEDAVFQIMIYTLIYNRKYAKTSQAIPAIYDIPQIGQKQFSPYLVFGKEQLRETGLVNEQLNMFEKFLIEIVNEIFDENQNFPQTEDAQNCEYCPYRSICGR